jgi:hypothetical protein
MLVHMRASDAQKARMGLPRLVNHVTLNALYSMMFMLDVFNINLRLNFDLGIRSITCSDYAEMLATRWSLPPLRLPRPTN